MLYIFYTQNVNEIIYKSTSLYSASYSFKCIKTKQIKPIHRKGEMFFELGFKLKETIKHKF